jgi:hypothetical protein
LTVGDTGVGLSATAGKPRQGIGLGIARALSRQIAGTFDVSKTGGTVYTLRFKADRPGSRSTIDPGAIDPPANDERPPPEGSGRPGD